MVEIVSIDKAGRIVIPKAIRDAAGIDESAKLLIAATEKGRVVLQKLDVESLAARLEKELAGKNVDAIARRVRSSGPPRGNPPRKRARRKGAVRGPSRDLGGADSRPLRRRSSHARRPWKRTQS